MNSRRASRRLCAFLAVASGCLHLVLAGSSGRRFRSPFPVIRYAEGAIFGARYVVVLSGITLVLLARPLLHGKRTARWIAIIVSAVTIPGHHVKNADVVGMTVAVLLIATLVWASSSFRVRSDPARARQGWQLLGLGLGVVFVYGVTGLYLMGEAFPTNATVAHSITETLRVLVLLGTSTIEPANRHGTWFIDSVRVAALAVVFAAVVRLVATVVLGRGRSQQDEQIVRSLLSNYATSSLAFFHLLDDKIWFIASDEQAFVGYKLVDRCAVVLGEPVGATASLELVTTEFLDLCDANGWIPAFHQVSDEGLAVFSQLGLPALKIGEEAIVPVQEWSIEDRRYKSLRSAIRRVERAGYHFVELPTPLDDDTMRQLREVSDRWLASGEHRERTFTLGLFDPRYLQSTTVVAAVDDGGRIGAFANIVPSYRSSVGNFDLMRRDPEAPNGLMEFLFVGLIERFRREGRTGMTLGLAPLAGVTGDTLPARSLHLLYEHGEQAFNFRGLAEFKEKWQPRWEPRFLCYRRMSELPLVAAAVTRAGELPDERRLPTRLAAIARRYPVTASVLALVFWFMTMTAIEPRAHAVLLRHIGLDWHDLVHLQIWRLATSQLVQTKSGFAWGNIALLVPILPLAEHFLGSRRTIALFTLGDWLSTVPVWIGVRIAAGLGSSTASRLLSQRDGGVSSGAWVLALALALALPKGRLRTGTVGSIVGFNVAMLAVQHRIVDIQHAVALAVAFALVQAFDAIRIRHQPHAQKNPAAT